MKGIYLLLGDEREDEALLGLLERADFLVVQASYLSSATARASVVLPSPIWAEREGEYVSMDGRSNRSQRVLQPREGLLSDGEILVELAKKLGHTLS